MEPFPIKQRSTNNKAQFVLRETNVGGSNTNSSNFTMILSFITQNRIHLKTRVFPGFFSQLPETRVLKFCPELETLFATGFLTYDQFSHFFKDGRIFKSDRL